MQFHRNFLSLCSLYGIMYTYFLKFYQLKYLWTYGLLVVIALIVMNHRVTGCWARYVIALLLNHS